MARRLGTQTRPQRDSVPAQRRRSAGRVSAPRHADGIELPRNREGPAPDYLGALDRANVDIQKRLWADLEKIRGDYERLIHTELRLIRQRAACRPKLREPATPRHAAIAVRRRLSTTAGSPNDFAAPKNTSGAIMEFYRPYFAGCANVLDIGCGRGRISRNVMREIGVPARGIDLSEESVAQCRQKGLEAEARRPVRVSRRPARRRIRRHYELAGGGASRARDDCREMIRLCAAKLRRGGVLAIETPNPECLAIFATHFYLDPTHTRPVPHQLLAFYMEEAGFGQDRSAPAFARRSSRCRNWRNCPKNFRNRFFGGLDYAIIGAKL